MRMQRRKNLPSFLARKGLSDSAGGIIGQRGTCRREKKNFKACGQERRLAKGR